MSKPAALRIAETIEEIARRYHVTPAEACRQPAWILRHIEVLSLGNGE